MDPRLWSIIMRYAPGMGLDPRAAAAVAMNESGGRFGAVGDNGTSYGPWQLHVGGALPRGRNAAWANSLPGILYALRQMASVARGLHGEAAVSNIARRFERPANPGAEINVAMRYYNQPSFARGAPQAQLGKQPTGQPLQANPVSLLAGLNLAQPSQPFSYQTGRDTLANLFAPPQPTQEAQPMPDLIPNPTRPQAASELDQIHQSLLGKA